VFRDEAMLRYSLLLVNVTAHIAATWLLIAGVRPFKRSLQQLEAWNAAQR
jgi:hypothetical protein